MLFWLFSVYYMVMPSPKDVMSIYMFLPRSIVIDQP